MTSDQSAVGPAGTEPLFLLGAPRSGTSLVYKALCLHPRAAFISQWVQRYPSIPALAVLDRFARASWRVQRRAWFPSGNAYVYGRQRPFAERIYPAPAEGESVFQHAGITMSPVTEPVAPGPRTDKLRALLTSIRRWSGNGVLVVKRIANNRRVPLLEAAFPQARYIEIVRDGRAVALSLSRVDWWGPGPVWWLGTSPDDWEAEGGDPLTLCARHWVKELEMLERSTAHVDPERYLQVRYEDIIEAPVETLKVMADFAGLDADDPRWAERLEALEFPDRTRQGRSDLDDAALCRIEAEQRDYLVKFGYQLSQPDPGLN